MKMLSPPKSPKYGDRIVRRVKCEKCNGTGKRKCKCFKGTGEKVCTRCRGQGYYLEFRYSKFESFTIRVLNPSNVRVVKKESTGLEAKKNGNINNGKKRLFTKLIRERF